MYDETSPTSKKEQKKADRRQARKKAKGLILQTHSENPEMNEQNEISKMETQMDEMIQSAKKELEEGVGGGAGSKHDQRVAVRQEKRGKLKELKKEKKMEKKEQKKMFRRRQRTKSAEGKQNTRAPMLMDAVPFATTCHDAPLFAS